MPYEKDNLDMYAYAMEVLNNGKYSQYETSSYCEKNRECKHNLHYWKRDPYIAFGPSSHSFYNETRYWNVSDLNTYMSQLNANKLPIDNLENLNEEKIFNEIILNGLRMSKGINLNYIKNKFNQSTFNALSKKIPDWGNHLDENKGNIFFFSYN